MSRITKLTIRPISPNLKQRHMHACNLADFHNSRVLAGTVSRLTKIADLLGICENSQTSACMILRAQDRGRVGGSSWGGNVSWESVRHETRPAGVTEVSPLPAIVNADRHHARQRSDAKRLHDNRTTAVDNTLTTHYRIILLLAL